MSTYSVCSRRVFGGIEQATHGLLLYGVRRKEVMIEYWVSSIESLRNNDVIRYGRSSMVVRVRIDILFLFGMVTVSNKRQQWSSDNFMGGINS
ncbi:hypothetical protein TNCV_3166421 [Trichonephila clavipes]|uniref:Uncharacterized protein n=1 Tax=Trichonephila clavipes TaxID=2585209 RepID=A0A8X6USG8_TRICX|nr:hypothetical protein TNCV_3166421 [Trichonephila clavipes]